MQGGFPRRMRPLERRPCRASTGLADSSSTRFGGGMRLVVVTGVVLTSVVLTACKGASVIDKDDAVIDGARIAVAPPNDKAGEWLMPGRDYANSRYSELSEITPANAGNLRVAWTFSTGVL